VAPDTILIVQATRPWIDGRPYFAPSIVEAQRRAAPSAELFVARHSDHGTLVRDPSTLHCTGAKSPQFTNAIATPGERAASPICLDDGRAHRRPTAMGSP
jgi:hypothetical protein